METGHPLLAEFQAACQSYYACFVFSISGVKKFSEQLSKTPSSKGTKVFISAKDPTKQKATATLTVDTLLKFAAPDGHFADTLAKLMLVKIFTDWDEYYRPRFAEAIGVESNRVQCDLLGDLRLIRNCIVHAKSVITNEHQRIKILAWQLSPGTLLVTDGMFTQFIEQSHHLVVEIKDASV